MAYNSGVIIHTRSNLCQPGCVVIVIAVVSWCLIIKYVAKSSEA